MVSHHSVNGGREKTHRLKEESDKMEGQKSTKWDKMKCTRTELTGITMTERE